ncbi:MAG: DUF554 domain-containing protein [Oscillospiraceae bacterium]|nr:DUF554 domain-containing protein [Oscillospiraceae bacterium]
MIGLGTIANASAIVAGGLLGIVLKKALSERIQDTVMKATGICVMFIGIGGTMQEMLSLAEEGLISGGSMMMIFSFVLGALSGEAIDIEKQLERFGSWLRRVSRSEGDSLFLDGFITASLTVCIGAMAVVGAIEDGLSGDYSLLLAKSVLDFIIIMIMSASMGRGCLFSAVPVAVLQGSITLLAGFIQPLMTKQAISNLSMTGSMLIFCVGLNLVWGKKIRVANLMPTIIFAVIWALVF